MVKHHTVLVSQNDAVQYLEYFTTRTVQTKNYFVDLRVGSEAVGGGGGPLRSKSSM